MTALVAGYLYITAIVLATARVYNCNGCGF